MSWTRYHRRGDVLRTAADQAEERADGVLPTDVPGVTETFRDDLDLVGALHFRWHTRLTSRLEQRLATLRPDDHDPRELVVLAWADAARDLPGLRAVLDRQIAEPADPGIAAALTRATEKEQQLLASMAGIAGRVDQGVDPRAVAAGRRIEAEARGLVAAEEIVGEPAEMPEPAVVRVPSGSAKFVARIKAVLAA